jgi:peptidoglycan L-alanyl-D-glutamate endopeptidase CwlK
MPHFSARSLAHLASCHQDLRRVAHEAIRRIDFAVICGHRTQAEQDKAFAEKKSKLRYPLSKHNSYPARAMDLVPYPVDWTDLDRFRKLAAVVKQVAAELGVSLVWGGDWDGDGRTDDEKFVDMPHFELAG